MNRFLAYFLGLIGLLLNVSCGTVGVLEDGVAHRVDVGSMLPTDFNADKYLLVKELSRGDHAVFFYQDHEGYTHFFNGREDRVINREVIDKYKKLGAVPLAMNYGFDGTSLIFSQPVKWENKKQIVIKLDTKGNVLFTKELSELGQVMRPASFAFDGAGNTLMTWIDESPPRMKAIYALLGADGIVGKEMEIADNDGAMLYVEPIFTPKGFAIVYSRSIAQYRKNSEIHLKWLAAGTDSVIYGAPELSGFDLLKSGDTYVLRPYVPGESGTVLIFNTDFEQTKSYTLPYPANIGQAFGFTDALALTRTGPVAVGSGIASTGVSMGGLSLPQKPALYVSANGRSFERLAGGIPHMFTSEYPAIVSMGEGAVVGYSDRRYVNTVPMLATIDGSGELVKRDIALEPPEFVTGRVSLLQVGDNTVRAFYPVKVPGKSHWIYRFVDRNIHKMKSDFVLNPASQRQSQLLQAAQKYAACRLKDDYQCIYDLLDPKYRSGVSKAEHEGRMRSLGVELTGYSVDSCEVMDDSILGRCKGEISAKLPATMMGKPIPDKQRNVTQPMTGEVWVNVDGGWYYAVVIPMLGYAIQW